MRLATLVALTLLTPALAAQAEVTEQQKLSAGDGAFLDSFGRAVSLSGNRLLVSAFADDDVGSVTIYNKVGGSWVAGPKLMARNPDPADAFGIDAVLLGNTALIGAEGDDDGAQGGAVYVFEHDGAVWQESDKLFASDAASGDQFGSKVAAAGDVMVVGAYSNNGGAADAGAAYVFRKVGGRWIEEQKLTSPGPVPSGFFGFQVATDGNVIVVGAVQEGPFPAAGRAHVFRHDGSSWQLEQTLLATIPAANDTFGAAVAVDGDLVAVGAYGHDGAKGALFTYRWDGVSWALESKLQPAWAQAHDWFGWSVDIDGDRLVTGAVGYPAGAGEGTAVHYRHDGSEWIEVHAWRATSPGSTGFFLPNLGFSVDVQFRTVAVGAPWADGASPNSGAAYLFEGTDLAHQVTPGSPAPNGPITFRTHGGQDGALMGVFVIEASGIPVLDWAFYGVFDTQGMHVLPATVPAIVAGIDLTLVAFGYIQPGIVGHSDIVTVPFGT